MTFATADVLWQFMCDANDNNIPEAVGDDQAWAERFGPPGVDGGGWTPNLFINRPNEFDMLIVENAFTASTSYL